jgi:hypothetical protein
MSSVFEILHGVVAAAASSYPIRQSTASRISQEKKEARTATRVDRLKNTIMVEIYENLHSLGTRRIWV